MNKHGTRGKFSITADWAKPQDAPGPNGSWYERFCKSAGWVFEAPLDEWSTVVGCCRGFVAGLGDCRFLDMLTDYAPHEPYGDPARGLTINGQFDGAVGAFHERAWEGCDVEPVYVHEALKEQRRTPQVQAEQEGNVADHAAQALTRQGVAADSRVRRAWMSVRKVGAGEAARR